MISLTIPRAARTRPRSRRRATAALAGLTMIAAACGTKDAPDPLQPSGPTGRVRFVNLITDPARNPVNAILEGVPFGVNLAYTAATPPTLPAPSTALYSAVLAGDRSIVLKRTADTSVTVATLAVSVAASNDYTVFATGGTGGGAVTGFVTTDVNTAVEATQSRVRVVQMSPAAGTLDVFITAPNADLAAATPVAAGLAYRAAADYVTLAPGPYRMRAVPAGTAPAARGASVVVDLASLTLPARGGRTIVTADNATGGGPVRAFVLSDQ